jgi:hypothetical protein
MRMLLVLLAVLVAGCSTSMHEMRVALGTTLVPQGQQYQRPATISSESSLIYVYRNIGWAEAPDVSINGRTPKILAEGAFIAETVTPGKVDISVSKNPSYKWSFNPIGVSAQIGKGERRYFRIGAGLGGMIITPWVGAYNYQTIIQEVPESIAETELSYLRSMR